MATSITPPTETVTLRNGTVAAKVTVAATTLTLRRLMKEQPMVIYDLASLARDPSYLLFPPCKKALLALGLISEGGGLHGDIRNIVLSSVQGEGMDMALVNPLGEGS